ncbi:glycosyltransferase family 4 protein [Aerococcaceae bacterium NML171108]|nr:glycosyltransferase family 4 protein [Aerococcaceae bacterium NML171108]
MDKVLILASVASMIDQFNRDNIKLLQDLGNEVHVVANFTESGTIPPERSRQLIRELEASGATVFDVAMKRLPFALDNIKAYRDISRIMREENYNLVHCQSPIGGILGRLAAKNNKVPKVLYTAHGFHFYKGAPWINWALYYPVEKILSRYTDYLITINNEDYNLAAHHHMFRKNIFKVPGIGVNKDRLEGNSAENYRDILRSEFSIHQDELVLIYIAEINANKNQQKLIDAVKFMQKWRQDIKLLLVGAETDKGQCRLYAQEQGMNHQVIFTGWRRDIGALLRASDICVASSIREGFGLNLAEAMTCGLPVVAFDNRGHREIVEEGINGYLVQQGDIAGMATKIQELSDNGYEKYSRNALQSSEKYSQQVVMQMMEQIYRNVLETVNTVD